MATKIWAKGVSFMLPYILWGAVACVFGAIVGFLNFLISKTILQKDPNKYALGAVLRQLINIGCILLCYTVGRNTVLPTEALLIGSVIGITVTAFVFTHRLLKLNQRTNETKSIREEEDSDG